MAAIKLDIGNIIKNMIGYFWGNEKDWENDTKPIKYVVAKDGLYEVRETEILKAVAKPKQVKGIDLNLEEGITMKTPKIPYELYYQALKFLRTIYNRDQTEASILFFWDREKKEHFLWVPKQVNGSASSDYERDKDEEFTKMCEQYVWVMTAHSHPTFAGSFSSIDDKDEKDTRLFMVVGHIMNNPQDIAIRTAVNGKYITLKFNDVFTSPIDETKDAPKEWLDKCVKKVAKPVYSYGKYGSAYSSASNKDYGYASQLSLRDYDDYYDDGYYYGQSYNKNKTDEIFEDIDNKYACNQYGIPIGLDENLDEAYYDALAKDNDYVGDDPGVVNAIVKRQLSKQSSKTQKSNQKSKNALKKKNIIKR